MFETVRGAQLYYKTYGSSQPGQLPVLLVHGALSTGRVDWGDIPARLSAALAVERRLVIVTDCRGHGRSNNPAGSYRFAEMAADAVALARQLGHPRAHVIGHSNGGNVALLILMDHAEAVASCVVQAANAYVSADLVEREPPLFDPDGLLQRAPGRAEELQALHGEANGPNYWRRLLQLTLSEILAGPNYSAADLSKIRRPVLVIQGADDTVNAPGRHAQFMAENIPGAELWLPAGVGHTVHQELPDEWLRLVAKFIRQSEATGLAGRSAGPR
jgi:pimeloyl-ACP methyl ester carboxylesterase